LVRRPGRTGPDTVGGGRGSNAGGRAPAESRRSAGLGLVAAIPAEGNARAALRRRD
jgi:hypothetical protein